MSTPNIGARVKHAREALDLSLSELSRRTGITKSYLHDIETGRGSNLGAGTIIELCRELQVSADWLLGLASSAPGAEDEKEQVIHQLREENRALTEWQRRARAWYGAMGEAMKDP